MTIKEYKEKKSTKSAQQRPQGLGQTTLDGRVLGDSEVEESSESPNIEGLNGADMREDDRSRNITVMMPIRSTGSDLAPGIPQEDSDTDVAMENGSP